MALRIVRAVLLVAALLAGPSAAQEDCFINPTQTSCTSFVMPDAEIVPELTGLCGDMPYMVGCSLWSECKDGASGEYCKPMSLYATICYEMEGMRNCAKYNQLCGTAGSVVEQCTTPGALPNSPSTAQAFSAVLSMCADHSMPGCEQCTSRTACPDPMAVYSQVCLGMPNMADCAGFYKMCEAGGETFSDLCGTGGTTLPPMKMWVHAGISDILLFKEWVPRTTGGYIGALIGCIVAAMFVQALKAWRVRLEASWAAQYRVACCGTGPSAGSPGYKPDTPLRGEDSQASSLDAAGSVGVGRRIAGNIAELMPSADQMWRNVVRAVFTWVVVLLDYSLMLIVMSFNIGIILATVSGFALGALLFGHMGERTGAGPAAAMAGSMAPDSGNELEVHFVQDTCCC